LKAPAELWTRLDCALAEAASRVSGLAPARVEAVELARSEPDPAARAILAAQLSTRLVGTPMFEGMPAHTQSALVTYEDAVVPAIRASLELLAYEEVEAYILSHLDSPLVHDLRQHPEVRSRMRASVFKRAALERTDNVVLNVRGHVLTFLSTPHVRELGAVLVIDRAHVLKGVVPKVEAATTDGSRVLVQLAAMCVTGKGARGLPQRPAVIDLEEGRHAEPLGSGQQLVSFDDEGIVLREGSASYRVMFDALKWWRLDPW
jgi:hypothetical protein